MFKPDLYEARPLIRTDLFEELSCFVVEVDGKSRLSLPVLYHLRENVHKQRNCCQIFPELLSVQSEHCLVFENSTNET